MFYLNVFILFSFLGFCWESFVYKFSNSNKHSGALYGPYTLVYGIGFVLIMFVFNKLNLSLNFFNCLIYYLLFCICATSCEYLIGHLIYIIFHKVMWDYSERRWNFGKYICLDYFFLWGLFAFILIFFGYDFITGVIKLIPYSFSIFVLIIMVTDFIIIYLKSKN